MDAALTAEEEALREDLAEVPPPEPPRDPRLVALAEQAYRAGWKVEWQITGGATPWLRVSNNGIAVDTFAGPTLNCYAQRFGFWDSPSRTPTEALRAAYGALGVALDQAEDAFGQVQEQGEVK